eukprot:g32580.t1
MAAAKEAAERQAVERFVQKHNVEQVVQATCLSLHVVCRFIAELTQEMIKAVLGLFLVSRRITGKINPQETIGVTIKETMGLLNCDAVSLYVLDRKMQMLRLYTNRNSEAPLMMRLDQGIAGSVFQTQELVNIANCQQDSRFDRTLDMETGYFTRSMIVVPILDIEGQSCGVIQVHLDQSKVCSAERSTVFLVDDAAQQLWSVSTDTGAEIRIPKDKGIAGECCCQCRVINIPDTHLHPVTGELLQALGRELWVAGDALLTVSSKVRSGSAVALSSAAISLRNAAELMCDGMWEDVEGELEGAAASCESYLPSSSWRGLVDLFGYYEPVPECEWSAARNSLGSLATALEGVERDLFSSIRFADEDYIAETRLYFDTVLGKLRRAQDLFLPGRFYLPPDPRSDTLRWGEAPGTLEERFFGGSRQRFEDWKAMQDQSLNPDGCRDRAWQDARAVGQDAVDLLVSVEKELEGEADLRKRGRVLRKLLVKLHPDQNRGREQVTSPVFEYVQALRTQES